MRYSPRPGVHEEIGQEDARENGKDARQPTVLLGHVCLQRGWRRAVEGGQGRVRGGGCLATCHTQNTQHTRTHTHTHTHSCSCKTLVTQGIVPSIRMTCIVAGVSLRLKRACTTS